MQDMDILFLKSSDAPVNPSQEGLSLSVHVTRSTAKSSILENYENLVKIGSGNKISKLVAGFQVSCQSDASSNCLFSLYFRSKSMSPSAAKAITSAFTVLGSKGQTMKKSFFDNISPLVWNSNGELIDNGQKCSWKFSTGSFSVCFDEHSLASVMELVRSDSISSFEFKHCSNKPAEKNIQLEVSSEAKNKLPVLMTSLSLRSGQSLGFDQMASFGFECTDDKCSLNIAHDGDLNVNGLQNLLAMSQIISNSTCVPSIDNSAWVFYRRSQMLLSSLIFLDTNAHELKKVLNDLNITLWKTKTTEENSKTLNSLRALGDPFYTVSFDIAKIDSKLVTLMHLLNSELLSSTTSGCSFLRRLIKISINRQHESGIIQFSFSKATEMKDLKVASKFLELLCKIVDDQVAGPNVFKIAEKQPVVEINLALIADEVAVEKMLSPRDFKAEQREKEAEELRLKEAEETRKTEEAAKFAAEKERQQKLKEEAELRKQKAEEVRKERELQRKRAEERKEAERKAAEVKKQELLKLEKAKLEQRKAEEARRAEIAKQEREKAEQLKREQAKKAEEQRLKEAEQLKIKEEARIAAEIKKAELEKQRKAEEEVRQAEIEKQRKIEEAKQAELEKQRKIEEARKRKEAEEKRRVEQERLAEESRLREIERKAEELRIAEERRFAQEQKKAEAEAKAQAKKNREAARKAEAANQKKRSQFKLSEVQDVQRDISPAIRKKLSTVKDIKNIITVSEVPSGSSMVMTMEPVPQSSILQVLDMEYWLSNHSEFIKAWDTPKASPFTHFKEEFEFWVHQGEMGEKVNLEKFMRVFKPYQTITCLESLY